MASPVELEAQSAAGTLTEDGRPVGYVGTLTPAQEDCLRRMWDGLLAFLYGDLDRVKSLGYEKALDGLRIRQPAPGSTASSPGPSMSPPPTPSHVIAASEATTPTEEDAPSIKGDGAKKSRGGFWGGLTSSIASAAGRARSTTMTSQQSGFSYVDIDDDTDTGGDSIVTTSTRAVSLDEMRDAFWELILHDHPDSLLLRFLRARKWVVLEALAMSLSTLQWRIREDVAGIVRRGERALNLRPFEIGQSYVHGVDHKGRPINYINVRYHDKELQSFSDIRQFTIWVMETTRLMLHSPVETADILFDLADFTLNNMDYNFVKFIIQCFQAYYPESLGVYVVANAPFIFWGIWNIIKKWLDPVVASKFHCARELTDLQEFMPPELLPPALKGTSDYVYFYLPPRDEDDLRLHDEAGRRAHQLVLSVIHEQFLERTREWIKTGSPDIGAERDAIAADMYTAYFKLDPYVRARTFYHRVEVLAEDGTCDWSRLLTQEQYMAKLEKKAAAAAEVAAAITTESKEAIEIAEELGALKLDEPAAST